MDWIECKALIKADYSQLVGNANVTRKQVILGGTKKLITNASFKVTFWFRIGSYLKGKRNPMYKPLFLIVAMLYKH